MLEIRLLGEFDVRRDGNPVDLPSRPAQSLLAYLVLNANVRHRREKLAGLLWPDSEEANARSNLRHALWRLRKAIGDQYFAADKVSIAFTPGEDCHIDIAYFGDETSESETSAELFQAVSTYGGELLPGFYESWVVLERERLRTSFEHKIQRLIDSFIEKYLWRDVLEWGERWIALGQVPEPAFRALMIAHSGLGDTAGVAGVYQRCCEVLRKELGVEPSERTKNAYEWLSKGGDPTELARATPPSAARKASADSVLALLQQWRQQGVEYLDLASLAMVHAARTEAPYEPDDAKLLIRSAIHHEVDVAPWIKRAGTPQIAVNALDEVFSTYPKPRVRMRIVEALKGLQDEESVRTLLRIVEQEDSAAVRAEAAVAAARGGERETVIDCLLRDINLKSDEAAMAAFVAVTDEVGLPETVGPYPKLRVALALAQRRWRSNKAQILRQTIRASLGGAIAMMVVSVISVMQMSLTQPEDFQEALKFAALPVFLVTNMLLGLVWGGMQGAASGSLVGIADTFWEGFRRIRLRVFLAALAGFVYAWWIIFTAFTTDVWTSVGASIYVPVYLIFGLILGAAISLVIPALGLISGIRSQLKRSFYSFIILALASVVSVYLAYGGDINDLYFRLDLFMFIVSALLFPLGIALALVQQEPKSRKRYA